MNAVFIFFEAQNEAKHACVSFENFRCSVVLLLLLVPGCCCLTTLEIPDNFEGSFVLDSQVQTASTIFCHLPRKKSRKIIHKVNI